MTHPSAGADTPAARASVPRRLAAFGVDYLAIAIYLLALWVVSVALGARGVAPTAAFADPVRAQLLGFALLTLPVVLYFALWEGSTRQATPGKRTLGLRVVSVSGTRLPWPRSLLRSALKFAPWELAHAVIWRLAGGSSPMDTLPAPAAAGLGAVWLLVAWYLLMPVLSRTRQTPYDRLAGAFVVVSRPARDQGR